MKGEISNWDDFEKELNITDEQEIEIQLEMDIIKATIEARKKSNLSQRQLSQKAGIKQPVIARIESRRRSPQISTLLKMLHPMGYTLKVVPIEKKKWWCIIYYKIKDNLWRIKISKNDNKILTNEK